MLAFGKHESKIGKNDSKKSEEITINLKLPLFLQGNLP